MKKAFTLIVFISILGLVTNNFVNAQEEEKSSPVKITADVVSTYVWRGVGAPGSSSDGNILSLSPNIQPTFAFTKGNFEIGVWGSSDFAGLYREADLYASYSISKFAITFTDYNWNLGRKYFDYDNATTGHVFEGTLAYKGDKLTVTASMMLFGADKKYDKDLGAQNPDKNAYSSYLELGYALSPNASLFLGMTPTDGYYGDGYGGVEGFGVINLGVTGTKSIKITDKFELPLKACFCVNPQAETIHLVFGITL